MKMKRTVEKKEKWRKKKQQPNNRILTGIYLFLAASTAHRTHLWLHCVWLGLINTYNVAGNRASRARVIIGEHFGLHYRTKSLPPRCVRTHACVFQRSSFCVYVTERSRERTRDLGPVRCVHCMLSCWTIWTDRSFVTTVRAHLTRCDIEGQANTKALSCSLNASLPVTRQGGVCLCERKTRASI